MGDKAAEGAEKEEAVIMIQKRWRSKKMWQKIINFKKKMTEGGDFLKYSRKGVPAMTHVCCPPTLNMIEWKQVGAYFGGETIHLDEVKAVVLGRMTKSFMLSDKGKHPPPAKVNASFSVVTKDRSLDLECVGGERERKEWLDNFAFLLKDNLKESALVLLRH